MATPSYYVRTQSARTATSMEEHYGSTEHTVGPWSPTLQHGGPPSALLMRAATHLGGDDAPVPHDALPARVSTEIFRPVPVADIIVRARLVRPGARVAWAVAELATEAEPDRPVMRSAVWLIRRTPAALDVPGGAQHPVPPPGTAQPLPGTWGGGFLHSASWLLSDGSFAEPGPATAWTRLNVDLVHGEAPTGAQRAVVVADAGSGISAVADPSQMVFVNTELTIHLFREPAGEDVWMAAQTSIDPHGIGYAHTRLGDAHGSVGAASQTLFVEPR